MGSLILLFFSQNPVNGRSFMRVFLLILHPQYYRRFFGVSSSGCGKRSFPRVSSTIVSCWLLSPSESCSHRCFGLHFCFMGPFPPPLFFFRAQRPPPLPGESPTFNHRRCEPRNLHQKHTVSIFPSDPIGRVFQRAFFYPIGHNKRHHPLIFVGYVDPSPPCRRRLQSFLVLHGFFEIGTQSQNPQ